MSTSGCIPDMRRWVDAPSTQRTLLKTPDMATVAAMAVIALKARCRGEDETSLHLVVEVEHGMPVGNQQQYD